LHEESKRRASVLDQRITDLGDKLGSMELNTNTRFDEMKAMLENLANSRSCHSSRYHSPEPDAERVDKGKGPEQPPQEPGAVKTTTSTAASGDARVHEAAKETATTAAAASMTGTDNTAGHNIKTADPAEYGSFLAAEEQLARAHISQATSLFRRGPYMLPPPSAPGPRDQFQNLVLTTNAFVNGQKDYTTGEHPREYIRWL
jgi:hypothetical protein